MPHPSRPVDERAPAPADGALVVSGPDERRGEHNAEGLYVHGPLRARDPLAKMIAPTLLVPSAPGPMDARAEMLMRQRIAAKKLERPAPRPRGGGSRLAAAMRPGARWITV